MIKSAMSQAASKLVQPVATIKATSSPSKRISDISSGRRGWPGGVSLSCYSSFLRALMSGWFLRGLDLDNARCAHCSIVIDAAAAGNGGDNDQAVQHVFGLPFCSVARSTGDF